MTSRNSVFRFSIEQRRKSWPSRWRRVENEIGEPLRPALAQRLGQRIATLVGYGDLAVEDHRGQSGGGERPKGFAKHRGAVVAVAADERDVAAADDREQPVAIMLDLVQPASPAGGSALGETT